MQLIWAVWSLLYWMRSGLTESYLGHRGFALDERISQGQEFPWHTIRLPRTLFPTSYKITLQTDLKSFNVKGNVTIQVNCEKQTRHIILHLKDMKVSRTAVFETTQRRELFPLKSAGRVKELEKWRENSGGRGRCRDIRVTKTMQNRTLEMFLIEVSEELTQRKNYAIYIEFEYPLTDKLLGFYRSSYKTKSGVKRYLAATLFEPTFARAAFPCFDEPGMKAKFSVTIIREGKYSSLSNMPLMQTVKVGDDLFADHFQESVKMSTYMVAFLVSDFAHKETTTSGGIKVRIWTPPPQLAQASYALDIATKTLSNYEKFFQINFPLPKQDLVVIPDYSTGAEENWGLIGFTSSMLLFDRSKTSDELQQSVCETVTHELAHQWFGNLVTMKWWNDLWLNEGFATYMENIGASFVELHWSMLDQFVVKKLQVAFSEDQSSYSHPISVDVRDPKDIDSLFDSISYEKGASVIRMLKNTIGHDHFTAGLRSYLQRYAYSNADTDELWGTLSEKSGINVKEMMDTWTLQMGLPVVTIKRLNQHKAIADQKIFLIYSGARPQKRSQFNYTWNIPLTYETQKDKKTLQVWLNRGTALIAWSKTSGWIKANVDQIGYYRVNYDIDNWKALYNQLNTDHTLISAADRSGLIDDAFHLARSDELGYELALEMIEYIRNEAEYSPLITFLRNMDYIGEQLTLRKAYDVFKRYMLQQLRPSVWRLGWNDKGTHLEKMLRPKVLFKACDYSDQDIILKIKTMFTLAMEEGKMIPSNFRSLVYSVGVKEGGAKEWNQAFEKYLTTHIASEKDILLDALTYTRNTQMIQRCLNYSLDKTKISSQDTLSVISGVASNPESWEMAWDFVRENWHILYKRYSRGSDQWPVLIKSLMFKCNTPAQLSQVTEFFKDYKPTDAAYRQVKMGIERIHANIHWLSRHEEEVTHWLNQHVQI
ncbi:Glutamyl aminopeptidase [Stylophora pistillata]|uniref:Aminopeptidase n=2 Tax=Stylophora pistillata TaxID=50429 RepID=A0A2B4RZZ5_STYPI|nr:Glutamyl aminopeptidase [Stylophora pistillata]